MNTGEALLAPPPKINKGRCLLPRLYFHTYWYKYLEEQPAAVPTLPQDSERWHPRVIQRFVFSVVSKTLHLFFFFSRRVRTPTRCFQNYKAFSVVVPPWLWRNTLQYTNTRGCHLFNKQIHGKYLLPIDVYCVDILFGPQPYRTKTVRTDCFPAAAYNYTRYVRRRYL